MKKLPHIILKYLSFFVTVLVPFTVLAAPADQSLTETYATKELFVTPGYKVFATTVEILLIITIVILAIYALRHFIFALSRLFSYQRHPYAEIIDGKWPSVTILTPAHNEENVIGDLLEALMHVDYPPQLMQVIAVNDRSTDGTTEIIDKITKKYPGRIQHFNRQEGVPGKSAALCDAQKFVKNDVVLVFDADNVPGPFLIKQLVSAFFDPEVGSVMGRAVPVNSEQNLLTRLLDIERSGGYQVNQQARENIQAVPQYGGTGGGVRTVALEEVGGWHEKALAEDTEITLRLLENDWKTAYANNAECLEQVPETWKVRINQITRWAKGHNQVFYSYLKKVVLNKKLNLAARIDGALLLGVFLISPVLLFGWVLFLIAYYLDIMPGLTGVLAFFIAVSFSGVGNFTVFYELSTAVYLDNLRNVRGNRIRLLPFSYFSFFIGMFILSKAFFEQITIDKMKKGISWERTDHPKRKKDAS